MRWKLPIIVAAALLSGCAASNNPTGSLSGELNVGTHYYATEANSALAFDPPAQVGSRALPDLSRDDREASAYGGFQGLSAESYDVQVDDDQEFINYPSSYERRVQSDRVGVIFR